jgi:uncharacterized protein YukE
MAITQGANPEQLRTLAASLGQAGRKLDTIGALVSRLSGTDAWRGADADEFRTQWHRGSKPQLAAAVRALEDAAKTLRANASAQEATSEASTGTPQHGQGTPSGPAGAPGAPAGPGGPGSPGPGAGPDSRNWVDGAISDVASAQAWPAYGAVNTAVSGAGFAGDTLVARMAGAGLVTSKGGTMAEVGCLRGMQTVNGVRLAGQGASVLGIIGGGAQLYDGIRTGNTYEAVDGGITAVLATGALVGGPAAPAFAVAGLVWGGAGLLASSLGYSSTSAMFTAAGKSVYTAGKDVVSGVADGAKKAWGWLTG